MGCKWLRRVGLADKTARPARSSVKKFYSPSFASLPAGKGKAVN